MFRRNLSVLLLFSNIVLNFVPVVMIDYGIDLVLIHDDSFIKIST